jgi:hypothetical protein
VVTAVVLVELVGSKFANKNRTLIMNPSEPTIATPRKLILIINDTSSREGFVVTMRRRLADSINSRRFNEHILPISCCWAVAADIG